MTSTQSGPKCEDDRGKGATDILIVNPSKMSRPETTMLSDRLADDGYRVSVVVPTESKETVQQYEDVNYVFYNAWFVPGVRYPIPFPSFLRQLFALLKRADVALVTSYIYLPCLLTALLSRLSRTPCVISVDVLVGVHWSYGSSVVDAIAAVYTQTVGRVTFRLCDLLVAPGEYARADLTRFVDDRKITVVPNGVDTEHFCTDGRSFEVDDTVELLFVGRLAPVKNIPLLLRSVNVLRERGKTEYALTVVGDGDEYERYEALAAEVGVADLVTFEGYQTNVRDYYRNADILVLTSISEGLPTVLIEAQACGTPVVSTDVGGAHEIVAGGTVVPHDDPEAIAAAIADVADKDLDELAKTAREHVENRYSREKLYRQYEDIFLNQISSI